MWPDSQRFSNTVLGMVRAHRLRGAPAAEPGGAGGTYQPSPRALQAVEADDREQGPGQVVGRAAGTDRKDTQNDPDALARYGDPSRGVPAGVALCRHHGVGVARGTVEREAFRGLLAWP